LTARDAARPARGRPERPRVASPLTLTLRVMTLAVRGESPPMAEQKAPRVIKRYANRKLYDMSESCYITHDEIAALVRRGEEIKIIDNRTKEDLTTATLTQILFEKERKTKRGIPVETLRTLIQTGGEFVQSLRDEAEKKLPKVFRPRDKAGEVEEPIPE